MEQIQRTQNTKLGIFLLIAGLALFCVGETIVKILANDYEITQIVWARYVFHGLVTVLIFLRFGFVKLTKPTRPWLHMLRSALMLIATTLYFSALRFLPLADAVAIHFIAPILITAFSIPILKEKVGPRRWAAIFVGFVGTIIIIRPGTVGMHWAALLPLGTAICYAVYQILTRIASRTDSTQTNLFWTSAFGILATSFCVPFFWTPPSATGWSMMIALGGIYGLGHYLLIRGLEIAPASRLAPFIYTQIIWATILGFAIFNQLPDQLTILGVCIVIGSGLYIWRRETKLTYES